MGSVNRRMRGAAHLGSLAALFGALTLGGTPGANGQDVAPGRTPVPAASAAAEQAAHVEWRKLGEAVATGSRVPRIRYQSISQKYPHTRAAYEANLELAKLDYAALESQKKVSRTNAPVAEASKRFLQEFAYGTHAHPPMPDLKQRYVNELHPLFFNAVRNIGTWQASLEYLAAYPSGSHAAEIEQAIERAILNPNAGWAARDVVTTYAPIRPERVRELQLAAQVETNLFQALHEGLPREALEKFLQAYPGSIYFSTVEAMIKKQLARQVSPYSDRATLEDYVAKQPGSVDGVQAKSVLDELAAQEAAYRTAASVGTVEALQYFIAENPRSRYLNEAAKRIEAIKLASLSSSQQAALKSYEAQIAGEMRTEEAQLASYQSKLEATTKAVEAGRKEARALQLKSSDKAAEAREKRRLAGQSAKARDQLQRMVKQNPGLQPDLEKRKTDIATYQAEAKKLDAEAAQLAKQAETRRTKLAEEESALSALREEARQAQVAALGKRNRLHHEYLARLDEAWNARGGR